MGTESDSDALFARLVLEQGLATPEQVEECRRLQESLFERALEIDTRYAMAYYNRAIARQAAGNLPGALEDYDRALEINPRYATAYYNRGVARAARGDRLAASGRREEAPSSGRAPAPITRRHLRSPRPAGLTARR